MSDKIKPSEVSQVLLDQLKGISGAEKFDEVGTVLTVSDGVARIYGLRNVEASELLEFENGTMAIVMNLEEDNVGCVLLGNTSGIKEGMVVKRTRVINPLGQAIDGKGDIDLTDAFEMPLDRKAPGVIYRQPVKEPLQTGLKAIDSMIPIGRGQRELIIGDRQTGKTAIAVDTIINQKSFYEAGKPVYCIYVAIGQKASLLYLCRHRPEGIDRCSPRLDAAGARRHALHHRRGCYCCRPCRHAVLCTVCRCRHRRVFPRPWSARTCRLR